MARGQVNRMQSESLMKCGHGACRCLVETEDEFCSAACAQAKARGLETCECGHSECATASESVRNSQSAEAARYVNW